MLIYQTVHIRVTLAVVKRRAWRPTPVLLPGKSYRQRSLVGYSPWDCQELGLSDRARTVYMCELWVFCFVVVLSRSLWAMFFSFLNNQEIWKPSERVWLWEFHGTRRCTWRATPLSIYCHLPSGLLPRGLPASCLVFSSHTLHHCSTTRKISYEDRSQLLTSFA